MTDVGGIQFLSNNIWDDTTCASAPYYEMNSITSSVTDCISNNYVSEYYKINNNKKILDSSEFSKYYLNSYSSPYDTSITASAYKERDMFANHPNQYYYENTGVFVGTDAGSNWRPSPSERMRQMIQARMAPVIHRGRNRSSLSIAMDVREERARQTLRRIIGEQAYRKFFRDGFITVVPKSGLTYRIFPGHGMTEVYDRGIMVDRLCVVLQGNFPPTDSLIMRYLLILNDEGEFSKYAVKHHVSQSSRTLVFPGQAEVKPLTEAWAKLKVA